MAVFKNYSKLNLDVTVALNKNHPNIFKYFKYLHK